MYAEILTIKQTRKIFVIQFYETSLTANKKKHNGTVKFAQVIGGGFGYLMPVCEHRKFKFGSISISNSRALQTTLLCTCAVLCMIDR